MKNSDQTNKYFEIVQNRTSLNNWCFEFDASTCTKKAFNERLLYVIKTANEWALCSSKLRVQNNKYYHSQVKNNQFMWNCCVYLSFYVIKNTARLVFRNADLKNRVKRIQVRTNCDNFNRLPAPLTWGQLTMLFSWLIHFRAKNSEMDTLVCTKLFEL